MCLNYYKSITDVLAKAIRTFSGLAEHAVAKKITN